MEWFPFCMRHARTLEATRNQNNSWATFQATYFPMNAYHFHWQLPAGGRTVQEINRVRVQPIR